MRIKFFSKNDMSLAYYMNEAKSFIESHSELNKSNSINDILELYSIKQLFDTGLKPKDWSDNIYDTLKKTANAIPGIIGRYSVVINNDTFLQITEEVEPYYRDVFVDFFSQFKIYRHISSDVFICFLKSDYNPIRFVLQFATLVKYYDEIIHQYIISSSPDCAELLMAQYMEKRRIGDDKDYYFPESLQQEEKIAILSDYIDSDNPNINYLELIKNSLGNSNLIIDDELRLKAKRRLIERERDVLSSGYSFPVGAEIMLEPFKDSDREGYKVDLSGDLPRYSYNKRWLEDNLDYNTILQNFIYLFEYTDEQFNLNMVSLKSELSVFEGMLGVKGKQYYPYGVVFNTKDILSSLQMALYKRLLLTKGVRIENVISWFFSVYLKDEFKAGGFIFNAPTSVASIREQNRDLLAELDSVLRQFNLFVKYKEIDRELLELSSSPIPFDSINSLLPKKYAYAISEKINNVMSLLFSDQTDIYCIEKTRNKYKNFVDMIIHEHVKKEEFYDFQQNKVGWLLSNKIIYEKSDGSLSIYTHILTVLMNMFYKEVVNINCCSQTENEFINELLANNDLVIESTLFSRPEQHYLDFMLNHRQFSNGKDLRNRYMHGSNSLSEKELNEDNITILKIIIMIIIKINGDFYIKDEKRGI